MPRIGTLLPLFAALAGLVVAGCGSSSPGSSSGKDPASLAPRGAIIYGSVLVRPEGDAKAGVEAAGRKVLAGRELGPELQKLLDRAFAKSSLDYADDVKPWLGRHAAFFLSSFTGGSPSGAAVIETTDGGKALAAIQKAAKHDGDTLSKGTYRDTGYTLDAEKTGGAPTAFAILDGFLVAGTESGLHTAIDAQKGDALADTDAYKAATRKVTKDGIATFYVDTPHLIDAIGQASPQAAVAIGQLRGLPVFAKLRPIAAAVTANADAIRIDLPGGPGSSEVADAVAKLPADSWLAFAAPRIGGTIRTQLKAISKLSGGNLLGIIEREVRARTGLDLNRDILSWIKGISGYATGTSLLDLNAAIIITSNDPAASQRAVARIAALLARKVKAPTRRVKGGIEIVPKNFPAPITLAARGDKVVVAYGKNGVERALSPSGRLEDSASYRAAQKALGGRPKFLLYAPSILQLAQGLGATKSSGFQKALPYLQAYSAIAVGSATEDGRSVNRVAIGLK